MIIVKLPQVPRCILYLLVLSILGSVMPANAPASRTDGDLYFAELQKRLVREGFEPNEIDALFQHSTITFEARNVSLFFILRAGKMDHSHYTDERSIQKAKTYMERHKSDLDRVQKASGVDKSVITAIILVETRLGTTLGKSSVFNSLSSIAALDNPVARDKVWDSIGDKGDLTRQSFDQRAKRKSDWAYRELKAFMAYAAKENIDPLGVKGSFAGAMGIPQFMPSNIEHYARDGNADGTVDLFNHADAQASVANFLKKHGWKPGIDLKKKQKVVHHYNHSDDYVDTILRISDLLKA